MKYYKVVRKEKSGLFSSLVPKHNRFRRRYKKGEWTEPRDGSLLFVFCTKTDAQYFRLVYSWSDDLTVWECRIRGRGSIEFAAQNLEAFRFYKEFWEDKTLYKGRRCNHIGVPLGTVGAKRVKLIKEIG